MNGWIDIEDRSAIAVARRKARQAAEQTGFDASRVEEIAIVVTEAATNVLRHAGRGRILIEAMPIGQSTRLALIVADNGPGIPNLDRMVIDGESGRGTAGLGLGAMQRLSDTFDLWTEADVGTVIACEFITSGEDSKNRSIDFAGLVVCHPTESVCGDGWANRITHTGADLFLCDGLGHGPLAAEATEQILEVFNSRKKTPFETISHASQRLQSCRGGVAAMISLDVEKGALHYAGLGNISTLRVRDDTTKRFPVRDGQIGGPPRRAYEERLELETRDLFILHSDGLTTLRMADLKSGFFRRSPLLIAGVLLHRFFRGRDDASVVVVRVTEEV